MYLAGQHLGGRASLARAFWQQKLKKFPAKISQMLTAAVQLREP
jgi:hypothetical protein